MNNAAVIYDDVFLQHSPSDHPDTPGRLRAVTDALASAPFSGRLHWFRPAIAGERELMLVHSKEMIRQVFETSARGGGALDPDTVMSAGSLQAALAGAGSGLTALDLTFNKGYRRIFSLTRPPGHHATTSRSMGFCLFNNLALCARYALKSRKAERIAVIDWDVQHGNGTEEIFYTEPEVLFLSIHQSPLFPGTGYSEDDGYGRGKGYNINIPLPPGAGEFEYMKAFNEIIMPALRKYGPQLILISAGFGGHHHDPLAGHNLNSASYGKFASILHCFSRENLKDIPIIAFLEGGYNPDALAASVRSVLENWLDETPAQYDRYIL